MAKTLKELLVEKADEIKSAFSGGITLDGLMEEALATMLDELVTLAIENTKPLVNVVDLDLDLLIQKQTKMLVKALKQSDRKQKANTHANRVAKERRAHKANRKAKKVRR